MVIIVVIKTVTLNKIIYELIGENHAISYSRLILKGDFLRIDQ